MELNIAKAQCLPFAAPISVLNLPDSSKLQEVLAVYTGLCHREAAVRPKSNDCDLLGRIAELKNKINLCMLVIAAAIAVLIAPPEVRS
jgi:hypothetical protein